MQERHQVVARAQVGLDERVHEIGRDVRGDEQPERLGIDGGGRRAERFGNQSMGPSAVEGVGAPEGVRKQWGS